MEKKQEFKAIKLKEGEEILLVVRQTPVNFAGSILIGIFLFLLPFFLLFPLFSWGKWGIVIFCILLFGALIFSLYRFIDWYFNCGIITNFRVIDIQQTGLVDRVVSEVPYFKIDDVSYNITGFRQAIFKYGNVVIAIRGYRSGVTLQNVANPAMIQELILEVERHVRGWDEEDRKPVDEVMENLDKLNSVEKKALKVALGRMKKKE